MLSVFVIILFFTNVVNHRVDCNSLEGIATSTPVSSRYESRPLQGDEDTTPVHFEFGPVTNPKTEMRNCYNGGSQPIMLGIINCPYGEQEVYKVVKKHFLHSPSPIIFPCRLLLSAL